MVEIVKLKPSENTLLESLLPNDRKVEVTYGVCYLYDEQFVITEDMVERELNDK